MSVAARRLYLDTPSNAAIDCKHPSFTPSMRYLNSSDEYLSFMSWNMPNIIFRSPKARAFDQCSPFNQVATPGAEITVDTPSSANLWPSPNNMSSPKNTSPPTTVVLPDSVKAERAQLFVQGRYMELLEGMQPREIRKV
jgi:hypothetical protein